MGRKLDDFPYLVLFSLIIRDFHYAGIFAALGIKIQMQVALPLRAQSDTIFNAVISHVDRAAVVHDVPPH